MEFEHTTTNNISTTACFHCGEDCPSPVIRTDDRAFCCLGCQTVYALLQDHQLDKFYRLQPHPGSKHQQSENPSYDWIDDPEVQQKLVCYSDKKRISITVELPQIHCISCVWLLEHLPRLHSAIVSCRVNFMRRQARISFLYQGFPLSELMSLLEKIGYPPRLKLEDLQKDHTPSVPDRRHIYRLGIAGFAFGNIMLLSFPEYLGMNPSDGGGLSILIGYVSILLILPLLIYSAQDYWRSALFSLQQKRLSIDVPIALGMAVLFSRSVFEIISQTGTGYLDTLAGLIFFLLVGKWFQQNTFHRMSFERDFRSYFPIAVKRIEEGRERAVSLDKLGIGDRLIIRHGELIPADAILCSGLAQIDYSFVTGESEPVSCQAGSLLYAGGRQIGASLCIQLSKLPSQSYLTDLWNDPVFRKEAKTERLIQLVSPWFTGIILFVAAVTFLYWFPVDPKLAFNAFTAVLIIACPCALALATPFVFGNALRILSRKGIYLKNTAVVEHLARINAIAFDKTGTLTQMNLTKTTYHGQELSQIEKNWLHKLVEQSQHPVSRSIGRAIRGEASVALIHFQEIEGQGIEAITDGHQLMLGSAKFVKNKASSLPTDAGTWLSIDGEIKGSFRSAASYRQAIDDLFADDYLPKERYMLSGDGDQDRALLLTYFEADHLHFQQQPMDKLQFIRNLQKSGKRVLMLGDGLNDAGALRQSDVGIVISEDTNNFTPASDVILAAGRLGQLGQMLRFAKQSVYLVYGCFTLAFLYNIIGLSYAMTGQLTPIVAAILMPLSSISMAGIGIMGSYVLAKFSISE